MTFCTSGIRAAPVVLRESDSIAVTCSMPETTLVVVTVKSTVSPAASTGVRVAGSSATKSAGPVASDWTKKPAGSLPIIGRTYVTITSSSAIAGLNVPGVAARTAVMPSTSVPASSPASVPPSSVPPSSVPPSSPASSSKPPSTPVSGISPSGIEASRPASRPASIIPESTGRSSSPQPTTPIASAVSTMSH